MSAPRKSDKTGIVAMLGLAALAAATIASVVDQARRNPGTAPAQPSPAAIAQWSAAPASGPSAAAQRSPASPSVGPLQPGARARLVIDAARPPSPPAWVKRALDYHRVTVEGLDQTRPGMSLDALTSLARAMLGGGLTVPTLDDAGLRLATALAWNDERGFLLQIVFADPRGQLVTYAAANQPGGDLPAQHYDQAGGRTVIAWRRAGLAVAMTGPADDVRLAAQIAKRS